MLDIEFFVNQICETAYPKPNKWVYLVRDQFGFATNEQNEYKQIINLNTATKDPNLILVTWGLSGIDFSDSIDITFPPIAFDIMVSATTLRALNAFHWALMLGLESDNRVNLSALGGDVQSDEKKGHLQSSGRFSRGWSLMADDLIKGMEVLQE